MELKNLTEFTTLCELANFTRAAARLNMSPSALSRHIQQLESDLGVELVDRAAPNFHLTRSGHLLLKEGQQLLIEANTLQKRIRKTAQAWRNELHVGFPSSMLNDCLMRTITGFKRKKVAIHLYELGFDIQAEQLRKRCLDIAIIGYAWQPIATEFDLFELGHVPLCAILPQSHRLANKPVDLRTLEKEKFIGLCRKTFPGRNEYITHACQAAGFNPSFASEAEGKTAVMITVGATTKVSLLPALVRHIHHPGVAIQKLVHQNCCIPYNAAVINGESRSLVREFLQCLRGHTLNSEAFCRQ